VPIVASGDDHEVVRDRERAGDVENDDVFALALVDQIGEEQGQLSGVDGFVLLRESGLAPV
jgi:hypothetical protein